MRLAAPSSPLLADPLQPFGPLGAERTGQLGADARGEARALAGGRDGEQQVAAAHLRGIVEIAEGDDVLDVDEAAASPGGAGERRCLGDRQVGYPQQREARKLGGGRQAAVQPVRGQLFQVRRGRVGEHGDLLRTTREQQLEAALGRLAAADQDHGVLLGIDDDRNHGLASREDRGREIES